ncbi:MAG: TerB family tellurite resistance protein [Burkholderiaceae bacterium]
MPMLQALKELFDSLSPVDEDRRREQEMEHIRLALAVLLLEVTRVDTAEGGARERDAVKAALQKRFSLGEEALKALMEQAEQETRGLYDYQHFTSLLNEHFTHPQKIAVVESMWGVAYADARLDANEIHLIGKIAALLYVTQGEYIGAKMRAKESAGLL